MVQFNEKEYYKYTNNVYSLSSHPSKEDIPYLLEHVFDLDTGEYTFNPNNCCYYNPVDISDYSFSVSDSSIISVDNSFLYANRLGSAELIVENERFLPLTEMDSEDSVFNIKINVVRDINYDVKLNGVLFIVVGGVISLNNLLEHICCTHYFDCIWERGVWDKFENPELYSVIDDINSVKKKLKEYQNIIDEFNNGAIIYHKDFEEEYIVKIIDGGIDMSVRKGFLDRVRVRMKSLELDLKDLNRLRFDLQK